jgi:ribosomal protein L11 methyltransferase
VTARGRWLEVRARVRADGGASPRGADPAHVRLDDPHDALAAALIELGGRAVEDRDGWLVTHFPEPEDPKGFLAGIGPTLEDLVAAPLELAHDWRDPEDWAESWKRGLAPRRITPRLWVTPSWERAPAQPGDVVVVVDPGMAFGTAEHGTTRGALRLLDRALTRGERVLDVGSGSAILAVAAALLGAGEVIAVEGDPVTREYAQENIERNGVADRVRWVEQWADPALLRSLGPADGILANIESGVLRRLMSGLWDALRPGGWLVLSGIPAEEWDGFSHDVVQAGFVRGESEEDAGWRSGRFTRPAAPSADPRAVPHG